MSANKKTTPPAKDESYDANWYRRHRTARREDVVLEDGEVLPDYPVGPEDARELAAWLDVTDLIWR